MRAYSHNAAQHCQRYGIHGCTMQLLPLLMGAPPGATLLKQHTAVWCTASRLVSARTCGNNQLLPLLIGGQHCSASVHIACPQQPGPCCLDCAASEVAILESNTTSPVSPPGLSHP
jgi:hypothetical protein